MRDVVDRVTKLAPFLEADADPYPVLVGGRVQWVVDLYTTTSRYPYAQMADTDQVSSSSGLNHRLQLRAQLGQGHGRRLRRHRHLLRDGRPDDPIIDAYRDAFPDLFTR